MESLIVYLGFIQFLSLLVVYRLRKVNLKLVESLNKANEELTRIRKEDEDLRVALDMTKALIRSSTIRRNGTSMFERI